MSSQAQQINDGITIPRDLLEDLVEVCGCYRDHINGFFKGETLANHPDLNAVAYLRDEATRIAAQARAFLEQPAR